MKASPRLTVLKILTHWERTGQPIDQVMAEMLEFQGLREPRDRDLAFALVYGTLRWRGYLDWVLTGVCSEPLAKLRPLILQAMRLGLYQMLFMDRIPDSAAVNETIKALEALRQPKWLRGFANAVLRAAGRRKDSLPAPWSEPAAGIPAPARLSHPAWLIERWVARYGEDSTAAICRANNLEPLLCLRVNTRAITVAGFLDRLQAASISARPGAFGPEAVILPDFQGPVNELPGYRDGLFQVQDEAAQLVSLLLGPLAPDQSYLDGCAGLGGKTSHLAQMLAAVSPGRTRGRIVAVEPSGPRLKLLAANLQRLALSSYVEVVAGRLETLAPQLRGRFGGVLIDAPCSGLGVIRRQPDIRWHRAAEDLLRYQQMQLGLLNAAAPLLTPAGVLVYATCSMEPEENEQVVGRFLAEHPDFTLVGCRPYLPPAAVPMVDAQGFFRTEPSEEGLGGFFAARMRKQG